MLQKEVTLVVLNVFYDPDHSLTVFSKVSKAMCSSFLTERLWSLHYLFTKARVSKNLIEEKSAFDIFRATSNSIKMMKQVVKSISSNITENTEINVKHHVHYHVLTFSYIIHIHLKSISLWIKWNYVDPVF